jgi:hypothetical protein
MLAGVRLEFKCQYDYIDALKWWNEKEINNPQEVVLGVVIPAPGGPKLPFYRQSYIDRE